MLRNRIILLILIIGSGVLASFYGGNISYTLFYLTLAVPVVAFLYTFYVFVRFKLYQEITNHNIVKGETTGYSFVLANEDVVTYQELRVNFYSGMSTIRGASEQMRYCLLPSETQRIDSELSCHFRGVYNVGVKSIVITDLFNLFHMTYPIRNHMSVIVLPRIVQLEKLNILPLDEDSKNSLFRVQSQEEELDIDVRKYVRGDSRRQIHWKSTARRGELMSRRYTENLKVNVVLCMDLAPIGIKDMLERAGTEDKIIESAISIADYCLKKNVVCDIFYSEKDAVTHQPMRSREDFDVFYAQCGKLGFESQMKAGEVISQSNRGDSTVSRYIILTHDLSRSIYTAADAAVKRGNEVVVVVMRDELTDEQANISRFMSENSIQVMQIQSDEEFAQAFERTL